MASKVDFEEIKALVGVVEVAQWLGIKTKQTGDTYRGDCVLCGAERSFTLTPKRGLWGCFKCQNRGSILDLVHHVRQTANVRDAALLIQQHFLGDSKTSSPAGEDSPANTTPKRREDGNASPNASPPNGGLAKVAERLQVDHPIIPALGLTPEVCQALGWGYVPNGVMKGRFLVALRRDDGQLVGFLGIATKEEMVPLLSFPKNLAEMVVQPEPKQESKGDGTYGFLRVVK